MLTHLHTGDNLKFRMKKSAPGNVMSPDFRLPNIVRFKPLIKIYSVFGLFLGYIFLSTGVLFASIFYLVSQPKPYNQPKINRIYNLFSSQPPVLGSSTSRRTVKDARPVILEQFFAKYHSPLAAYGEEIIKAADENQIPWVLLPAISGQESTFCRDGSFPEDSYNCWGWAIHTQYTKHFASFEEGITKVSAGLQDYYKRLKIDREAPLETQVAGIKKYYNSTSKSWDKGVNYFIAELVNFATN